ncbi:hypothetical protein [Bacteroides bouchesdurhonensis]
MKMKLCPFIFLLALLLVSCDSYFKKLKGTDYSVGWIDMPQTTTVYYDFPDGTGSRVGVVGGGVTDVYWNKNYILAKRWSSHADTLIGYYVIKIFPPAKKAIPCKTTGPLSEKEYEKIKKELGLNEKDMRHINLME